MNSKLFKKILYLFLLIIIPSFASATLDQLINSYDYSYDNGTITVVDQTDYMIDSDSNEVNDTLIINLTTNPGAIEGTYKCIVELVDKEGALLNYTTKSITASNNVTSIKFKTTLLSKNKFNYSIRVNDINDNLVFRKHGLESDVYGNYEKGINITAILDQNIDNKHLRVNLTLDVTEASTSNITIVLRYNDSAISSTEEKTLTTGIQNISIDFDNETIKSTHYYGNFTVDTVVIGDKIIDTDKNTSVYNYETFAKTSYIKDYTSDEIDTNNNNLSDYLQINFTVNIKTSGAYNLLADLYDLSDNYVASINETQTLSTGEQIWETRVNGSDIYLTKTDGPYILSFVKLSKDSTTKDIVYNPYTTNIIYYTDFERPLLPDLTVKLNVSFSSLSNETNLTINISNIGKAPAFNVFLDLFDNKTYTNNKSKSFLEVNEYVVYQFNLTNTTNSTIYITIADFNNYVDESNESNNVDSYAPPQPPSSQPPTYSNLHNNVTTDARYNDIINISLNVSDDYALSTATLYWNVSGIWTQVEVKPISGTSAFINFTPSLPCNEGFYACANISIKDSEGNENKTELTCFYKYSCNPSCSKNASEYISFDDFNDNNVDQSIWKNMTSWIDLIEENGWLNVSDLNNNKVDWHGFYGDFTSLSGVQKLRNNVTMEFDIISYNLGESIQAAGFSDDISDGFLGNSIYGYYLPGDAIPEHRVSVSESWTLTSNNIAPAWSNGVIYHIKTTRFIDNSTKTYIYNEGLSQLYGIGNSTAAQNPHLPLYVIFTGYGGSAAADEGMYAIDNFIAYNGTQCPVNGSEQSRAATPTGSLFALRDNGSDMAIFDSAGNLFLKNTLIQSTTPQNTSDDEFLLRDSSNVVVAKINSTGFMEIKGTLLQNQSSLSNPPGDDFLLKNESGNIIAYINESGYMFLKGNLYENSIN